MDLHFTADEPTEDEKNAVDECLFALPVNGRQSPAVSPARAPRHPGARRLDQPGGAQPCLPPPGGAAGRSVRSRRLLRPVPDPAAPAGHRARLRRHRLPFQRRRDALRGDGAPARHRPDEPGQPLTWHRSPCLGLCERAPAALVIAAGDPARDRALAPATGAEVLFALAGAVGPAGRPRPLRAADRAAWTRAPAPRRPHRSREPRRLPRRRRFPGAAPGDRDGTRAGGARGDRRRSWWAAAAPPSPPARSGWACARRLCRAI